MDRFLLKKVKERVAKYEVEGPQYMVRRTLPVLDARINRPALVVRGPMKGCVGDLLSVGKKTAVIYVDAKSDHIQRVSVKDVISS